MVWWFNTKVPLHNGSAAGYGSGIKASNLGSQKASEGFCENEGDPAVEAFEPALPLVLRDLTHQDSNDQALGSDTNEPEVLSQFN